VLLKDGGVLSGKDENSSDHQKNKSKGDVPTAYSKFPILFCHPLHIQINSVEEVSLQKKNSINRVEAEYISSG